MDISPKEAFNKEIQSFLIENPESNFSLTIKKIMLKFSEGRDYYSTFSDLTGKLGIDFNTNEIVNKKTGKTVGWMPTFTTQKNNKLGISERKLELENFKSPPNKLSDCYKIIAKELVYRIQSIKESDWINL